ncbi:MAG: Tat (twin-arginine translocation) pathway signal sequence domain protein, partial [Myxococcota bacterium]
VDAFVTAERWFTEQFAYLLDKLETTPDPLTGTSLLDSSLVLWCKEMGDSRLHVCTSVPFVLAGKACGQLQTGRYLRYSGDPHNKLLVSVCQLMGLNNNSFGDSSFGSGPLPGLV